MRFVSLLFALLTVAGCRGLYASQEAKDSPFVGTWVADLSKSKQSARNQFKSATLQISVTADTVTIASRFVDGTGQERHAVQPLRTDGTETPASLTPGAVLVARWLDARVLDTAAKKDGRVIALVRYEVSADGKTLTTRSTGMFDQVIVYDRQRP